MSYENDERLKWVDGRVSDHLGVPRGAIFTADANSTKSVSDARAVAMVVLEALFYFDSSDQREAFGCDHNAVRRSFKRVKEDALLRAKATEIEDLERASRRSKAAGVAA